MRRSAEAIALVFVLIFVAAGRGAAKHSRLSITHISNSGFLLSSGGKNVVIDALFDNGYGRYAVPSEELKAKIIRGDPPFQSIDVFLVTHGHGDHFDAPDVAAFLKHHRETQFVAPQEVCDRLGKEGSPGKQIRGIALPVGASTEMTVKGISLKVVRLKHVLDDTGSRIANLGYLITMNHARIIQAGDITIEHDPTLLEKWRLGEQRIDVLFLQYFDRSEFSARRIRDIIKPAHIVATHIPPADADSESALFLGLYPNGTVLKEPLDSIAWDIPR